MFPHLTKPLALIGMMGAGKSAVARVLGERFGLVVADLDAMLEAEAGCTVAEYFAREGEAHFRTRERELLAQVLRDPHVIVACGGGIVTEPGSRTLLREHCACVWLEVTPETAAVRLAAQGGDPAAVRPMLAGGDVRARLHALLAERAPWYAEVAQFRVPTDGRTAAQVADDLVTHLAART